MLLADVFGDGGCEKVLVVCVGVSVVADLLEILDVGEQEVLFMFESCSGRR